MEFLKERVYTALNADELKVGSKVVIAKNISALKDLVYNNMISTLTEIYSENNQDRFHGEYVHKCGNGYDTVTGTLCYLIREPEEEIAMQKAQIYKMRCCDNCCHCNGGVTDEAGNSICDNCDDDMSEWEY